MRRTIGNLNGHNCYLFLYSYHYKSIEDAPEKPNAKTREETPGHSKSRAYDAAASGQHPRRDLARAEQAGMHEAVGGDDMNEAVGGDGSPKTNESLLSDPTRSHTHALSTQAAAASATSTAGTGIAHVRHTFSAPGIAVAAVWPMVAAAALIAFSSRRSASPNSSSCTSRTGVRMNPFGTKYGHTPAVTWAKSFHSREYPIPDIPHIPHIPDIPDIPHIPDIPNTPKDIRTIVLYIVL